MCGSQSTFVFFVPFARVSVAIPMNVRLYLRWSNAPSVSVSSSAARHRMHQHFLHLFLMLHSHAVIPRSLSEYCVVLSALKHISSFFFLPEGKFIKGATRRSDGCYNLLIESEFANELPSSLIFLSDNSPL